MTEKKVKTPTPTTIFDTPKNERDETVSAARPERIPVHKQKGLAAAERPGFHRRFVNETQGNVDRYLAAGWVPVVGSENNASDRRAQAESQMGSVVRKVVNRDHNATCQTAILMEIPEELYQMDQVEKQKDIDRTEAALDPKNRSQGDADYGEMRKTYS